MMLLKRNWNTITAFLIIIISAMPSLIRLIPISFASLYQFSGLSADSLPGRAYIIFSTIRKSKKWQKKNKNQGLLQNGVNPVFF